MRRSRGVTLVEMLVSMLVLGALMGLVAQAVGQVERIVRAADETQRAMSERWGGGWALQGLMANLVAPLEGGQRPLDGDAARLRGYTTSGLLDEVGGVRRFEIVLRSAPRELQLTEVLYQEHGERDGSPTAPKVVALVAPHAVLRYVTLEGGESGVWPLAGDTTSTSRLPAAIQIRSKGDDRLLMSFPVMASGSVQPGEAKSPFEYGRR